MATISGKKARKEMAADRHKARRAVKHSKYQAKLLARGVGNVPDKHFVERIREEVATNDNDTP